MNILALDTSTKNLAIAILKNGTEKSRVNYARQMKHAKNIVRSCDRALKDSGIAFCDIDCIACGIGPGSYTGLRIGHAFVKGLAVSRTTKIYPFSSLELVAYNIQKRHRKIAVVLDARREKFYFSLYEKNDTSLTVLRQDSIVSVEEIRAYLAQHKDVAITGDALLKYSDIFLSLVNDESFLYKEKYWYVRAEQMHNVLHAKNIDQTVSLEKLIPAYLRISEAEEKIRANKG